MADWSDGERREFERYRRAGKEHLALQSPRIRVGDRVATPGGTGWAVEEETGRLPGQARGQPATLGYQR